MATDLDLLLKFARAGLAHHDENASSEGRARPPWYR
jgi:hypothetical protein